MFVLIRIEEELLKEAEHAAQSRDWGGSTAFLKAAGVVAFYRQQLDNAPQTTHIVAYVRSNGEISLRPDSET
jgi:hypothetical protein